MNKIRIAFIGAGYMTTEHAKAFADIEEAELCGIFSRTRPRAEKLAALYPGMIVCGSVSELYERTRADIVVVSVPEIEVLSVALECFVYPWMSLFEKPLGLDLAEAEIISGARKANDKVFVLLNRRQYGSTRGVIEGLSQTEGKRLIHIQDQEDIKVQAAKGTVPEALLNKWMYANAIHLVDYFCFLGRGEIAAVKNIVEWNPDDPGYVIAEIQYSSGDTGLYQAVWNAPAPWAVAVHTPAHRWEMKPLEQATRQDYGTRTLVPLAANEWDTKFKPGLRRQAEQAILAFREQPNTLPGLEDAMKSMRLVNAIYHV